jgi:hypothetical protein
VAYFGVTYYLGVTRAVRMKRLRGPILVIGLQRYRTGAFVSGPIGVSSDHHKLTKFSLSQKKIMKETLIESS